MKGDRLKASVLAVRLIPSVDEGMMKNLELPEGRREV